jgi:hypothetical protein
LNAFSGRIARIKAGDQRVVHHGVRHEKRSALPISQGFMVRGRGFDVQEQSHRARDDLRLIEMDMVAAMAGDDLQRMGITLCKLGLQLHPERLHLTALLVGGPYALAAGQYNYGHVRPRRGSSHLPCANAKMLQLVHGRA